MACSVTSLRNEAKRGKTPSLTDQHLQLASSLDHSGTTSGTGHLGFTLFFTTLASSMMTLANTHTVMHLLDLSIHLRTRTSSSDVVPGQTCSDRSCRGVYLYTQSIKVFLPFCWLPIERVSDQTPTPLCSPSGF